MKKSLLALFFVLVALASNAQRTLSHQGVRSNGHRINFIEQMAAKSGYTQKLVEWNTSDDYEYNHFCYDDQYRLVAVADSLTGEYQVIDSLFYNASNQLVRLSGWQRINGIFKNVYYVDYTYDVAGNIATRTNYNLFSGEWNLGGVYSYQYNADNQIIQSTLTMAGITFQQVLYAYADGLLQNEMWYGYDGYGLSLNEATWYTYNADRQLTMSIDSTSEDGGTTWEFLGRHTYEYDNYGNCTQHEYADHTGTVAERSVYTFDYDLPLAEVLMPWTPEQQRPFLYNNVHAYTIEEYYAVDVEHRLQYVGDYRYLYADIHAGIASAMTAPLAVQPNPACGHVTVSGLGEELRPVRLTDAMGREVLHAQLSASANSLDIRSLAPGIYVLSLDGRNTRLVVR